MNHFIELGTDPENNLWIIIHTGSRNFGLKVANHYQSIAKKSFETMGIDFPRDTQYLTPDTNYGAYMHCLYTAQYYASINREFIMQRIFRYFEGAYIVDMIESVHNYISPKDMIVRKGAISAYPKERVIIPLNMADGVIIGTGKGNPAYNFSAPHGAGRLYGRKEMKRKLASGEITMEGFQKSMEGVYSSTIVPETIDESKHAYKTFETIKPFIEETVNIDFLIKPIYNVKAITKEE